MKIIKKLILIIANITILIYSFKLLYDNISYSFKREIVVDKNLENIKDNKLIIDTYRLNNSLIENKIESAAIIDMDNDNIIYNFNSENIITPMSLAKIFTIEFILSKVDIHEIVTIKKDVLKLVPINSSIANIKLDKYFVKDLIIAMLLPSGNDAGLVLAEYIGEKYSKNKNLAYENINIFIEELNKYIQKKGYTNTILYDPNGYDINTKTNLYDLYKASKSILTYSWIKDVVGKFEYKIKSDKGDETLYSTNKMLYKNSEFYDYSVLGLKTGSSYNLNNLIIIYNINGKSYFLAEIGASTDSNRYLIMKYMIEELKKYL